MTARSRVAIAIVAAASVRGGALGAQPAAPAHAYVRDTGPGVAGRLLRDILARPHTVVVAPDTGIVFTRGTDVRTALVVIGGPVRLEGRVRGDVVVLGDLVLRPGAIVDGRTITFGGVVAGSSLAIVGGEAMTFSDVTFLPIETSPGTYALDYHAIESAPRRAVMLPGVYGVRIPTYDRVNGLSATFGPEIDLIHGQFTVEPTVTYRSHLGAIDGGAVFEWRPDRRASIELRAERGTYSNDAWIRADVVNSAAVICCGGDARNYYRADRAEFTVSRAIETQTTIVTPYVAMLAERAWSAASDSLNDSAPWSFYGRNDRVEGMLRPNPAVTGGHITSGAAGVKAEIISGPVDGRATLRAEFPIHTTGNAHFAQFTADGWISFPTFGEQSFQAIAHALWTRGDRPPSQRYAYLGGSSTIPTLLLLSEGGDQLAWLQSRYVVPITAVKLPLLGSPSVLFRHIVGGAAVDGLPAFTQNLGVRLSLSVLRVDFAFDPANTRHHELSVGLGLR